MSNIVAADSGECHNQPELFGSLASKARADIAEAQRRRDHGITRADASVDDFWRNTYDQRIHYLASLRVPFSANDCRELVPEGVSPFAVGARFQQAAREGWIKQIGAVRSTKSTSNMAWVSQWIGCDPVAA